MPLPADTFQQNAEMLEFVASTWQTITTYPGVKVTSLPGSRAASHTENVGIINGLPEIKIPGVDAELPVGQPWAPTVAFLKLNQYALFAVSRQFRLRREEPHHDIQVISQLTPDGIIPNVAQIEGERGSSDFSRQTIHNGGGVSYGVSRKHLAIGKVGVAWIACDLGSKHGTEIAQLDLNYEPLADLVKYI